MKLRERKNKAGGVRFRHSLMARYLMLVGSAIFLLPLILVVVTLFYLGYTYFVWLPSQPKAEPDGTVSSSKLTEDWHKLAASLDGASAEEIAQALKAFRESNPLIAVAAVDAKGKTLLREPQKSDLPETWTPGRMAEYMKQATAYNATNFSVVAFVGEKGDDTQDRGQGLLIAEVPRALTISAVPDQQARFSQIAAVSIFLLLFLLFAFMSWTFFYRIRKRLIRLQRAMTAYDEAGMPMPVGPGKQKDEVAALEVTFNEMVGKLRDSREREREEEELRKKLIANLSHDLRTPLTVIRSHAYSLESEPLGERGRESLALMAGKLDDLGGLIDNLLSYTLIAAGRYPMRLEETDVLRIVRAAAAQWYPVFEKAGMEVDADLPDEALIWRVDREWLVRILDNLFQNAVRHAKAGRYIGLSLGPEGPGGQRSLQVRDKGPGLRLARPDRGRPTDASGAGAEPAGGALMAEADRASERAESAGMPPAEADRASYRGGSAGMPSAEADKASERGRSAGMPPAEADKASERGRSAGMPPRSGLPGRLSPAGDSGSGSGGSRAKAGGISPAAGAGIGLSIVELMIREMGMSWSIDSGETGTVITIRPSSESK